MNICVPPIIDSVILIIQSSSSKACHSILGKTQFFTSITQSDFLHQQYLQFTLSLVVQQMQLSFTDSVCCCCVSAMLTLWQLFRSLLPERQTCCFVVWGRKVPQENVWRLSSPKVSCYQCKLSSSVESKKPQELVLYFLFRVPPSQRIVICTVRESVLPNCEKQ